MSARERLLQLVSKIENSDPELGSELRKVRNTQEFQDIAREKTLKGHLEGLDDGLESLDSNIALETIVLRVGRPVLAVQDNEAVLEFREAESEVWRNKLTAARPQLFNAITAVGRIELQNHPSFSWVGTGWLVDQNLVVTNRHVAEVFAQRQGNRFVFRTGFGNLPVVGSIDFLEEVDNNASFSFQLQEVIHIEPAPGADMAFIRIKPVSEQLLAPIRLQTTTPSVTSDVAVIGYPARDSRIPDQQLMLDIFGDVYDKKRLAPGQIIFRSNSELQHDCSTLGGNSGSVVLDLATGEAVGLHFAGRFLQANFAVPATVIAQKKKELSGKPFVPDAPDPAVSHNPLTTVSDKHKGEARQQSTNVRQASVSTATPTATFTIPLNISITLGDITGTAPAASKPPSFTPTKPPAPQVLEVDETFFTEAVPADYSDRDGYDAGFLGEEVPLPQLVSESRRKDIQLLIGSTEVELKYRHFSVVMSKSRRQCFFSACNIDGTTSVGMKRGAWRTDPRIPANAQILKECYGNPPKFSRGHMTRREDPIWGNATEAKQGNEDSMHVTNTVPQMQTMNGGIWLALENYALQNTRKDDMRISVFTGPIFKPSDPTRFGVKIPLEFWKIIAFIHDETGELCATGYSISQKTFLPEEEFIFGQHKTTQKKISWIEGQTGLSFGDLSSLDPLNTDTEALEHSLDDLDQIRFH